MGMQLAVRNILKGIDEDPCREGLLDTPNRVAKAMLDMLSGYRKTAASVIGDALFHEEILSGNEPGVVLVQDIEFASLSGETLLPFHGRAHVAYLPSNGTVLGLSKLARLVHAFSKRLQVQERLQMDLLQALMTHVHAAGAMVVLEAHHLTFEQPKQPVCVTAAVAGSFAAPGSSVPAEVLAMLGMTNRGADAISIARLEDSSCSAADAYVAARDQTLLLHASSNAVPAGASCCKSASHTAAQTAAEAAAEGVQQGCNTQQLVAAALSLLEQAGDAVGVEWPRARMQAAAQRYITSLVAATSGASKLPHHLGMRSSSRSSSRISDSDNISISMSTSSNASGLSFSSSSSSASDAAVLVSASTDDDWQELSHHHYHVPFVSQCEHHLLPFYGSLHITYVLPTAADADGSREVVSLDDLKRIVESFTKRLQLQERICQQVAEAVEAVTDAAGTFISCRAAHMCMVARGVENHGGTTVSTAARGVFNTSASLRLTCLKEAQRQQAAFACQHGLASKACGSNKGPLLCRHHHNSAATQ